MWSSGQNSKTEIRTFKKQNENEKLEKENDNFSKSLNSENDKPRKLEKELVKHKRIKTKMWRK